MKYGKWELILLLVAIPDLGFSQKEIENPMKMIYQTHAIRSVEDFKHQQALSNIMVDFVKPLGDITTKDFAKYDEIIKIGEKEAKTFTRICGIS